MGTVQCVITANFRLSRAFTGVSRISTGMRDCSTGEVSMKLLLLQKHEWVRTPVTTGGMQESLYGLDKLQQEEVWLTNVSSVTGKPNFLAEPDRGRGRVQTDRSRCKAGCLYGIVVMSAGLFQPVSAASIRNSMEYSVVVCEP